MSDSDKRGLPSRRGTTMAAQHPAANAPSAIAVRTAPRARYQKGWLLRCTGLDDITRLQKALVCRIFHAAADRKPTRRTVIGSIDSSAQLTGSHSVAYSAPCSASHCLRCS